jgi:hypothetical protein
MRNSERLARMIFELSEYQGSVTEAFPHAAEDLATIIEKRFGEPRLPEAAETVAVTLDNPKTGALFFDRLWYAPCMEDGPPNEVMVWGATDVEIWPIVIGLALAPPNPLSLRMRDPMYESADACVREYRVGETETIVTAVENLGIVNEARLDWQQVMDFRNDPDAKIRLRRMRHWFDFELVGKPMSYVTDAIATRLDDYEWALKKHGIETVTGSLSEVLDVRFLSAASAAMAGLAVAGGPSWAAIGAAGLLLGKATLSVTTKLVDLEDRKRGKGSEVAFIHELKRISGH